MSQLEYYGQDPRAILPHQAGLKAWGIVLIIFGASAGLFAVLALVSAAVLSSNLVPKANQQDPLALLAGVGVYVVAAAFLISMGIGSLKGRRWVRPLMMIATSLTISSGVIAVVPLVLGIIRYVQHPAAKPAAAPALPFDPILLGFAFGGCFVLVLMVILPVSLLWFYGRATVQSTLDLTDPRRYWTDRCPLPVLGWSIACVIGGVTLLSYALHGIFPCFTIVLVGVPAYAVILMLASMAIIGGILSYFQNLLGWLISFTAALVLSASFIIFSFLGNQRMYIDLTLQKLPAASRVAAEPFAGYGMIGPVLMYLAAVVYAIWLRARFKTTAVVPAFPAA